MKTYYVYRHVRLDKNVPFYIGIGTIKHTATTFNQKYYRAFDKSKSRNPIWKNIIQKSEFRVDILFHTDDSDLIKQKEKYFIKLYGMKSNKGSLVNLTEGGDGIEGFSHTTETKRIIGLSSKTRQRKRGYKLNMTKEGRNSLKHYMETRMVSEVTKQKFSENLKNNKRGEKYVIQLDENKNIIRKYKGVYSMDEHGYTPIMIYKSSKSGKLYKGFYWVISSDKAACSDSISTVPLSNSSDSF